MQNFRALGAPPPDPPNSPPIANFWLRAWTRVLGTLFHKLNNVSRCVYTEREATLNAKQRKTTRSNQTLTSSTMRERFQPVKNLASGCVTSLRQNCI